MRFKPPSLLARMFALAAALMLISALSWVGLYAHFERAPRAENLARAVVTMVNLVRPAVLTAQPGSRATLLREFAQREGLRIYPAETNDTLTPLTQDALTEALTARIRASLGPTTRFAAAVGELEGFWVSFELEPGDEYWLRLPAERISPDTRHTWLGWAALAGTLALLAAWVIVAHLTRPLSQLAHAARAIGRGQSPPPLPTQGPPEIAAVATAFNQMSADLAHLEADRAMSLAGISHDLRTPLARLRLDIEMSPLPDTAQQDMIGDIEAMDRIISQFLDYARGPEDETATLIDCTQLLDTLAQRFSRGGPPVRSLARTPLTLEARALSLERAVANLIQNAKNYAGPDAILLDARSQHDNVEIDIIDHGPGIAADTIDALKRAFVRGDTARSGAPGAGLGLAIVERIAKNHGGRLQLINRPEGGLTARLTLPQHPAATPPPSH